MSEFFSSLGSDLRDRRFLPILVLLGVALIGALAYAVLGGGSSSSSTPTASVASTGVKSSTAAVAITPAPETTSKQAANETTSGTSHPSGAPRDPFKPLPGANSESKPSSSNSSSGGSGSSDSGKSSGSSSGSSSSSSSSSSKSSGSGATTTTPLKPVGPPKPQVIIHFHVTTQFGVVPAVAEGQPAQPAQLQTFPDMKIDEPLPSKENPQLIYQGVDLKTGNLAVFSLTGEAILHGPATCKPSPTQCQAILLAAGQSETLEVVGQTGQTVTYELKVISITKSSSTASAARAARARAARARARAHAASHHHGRWRHGYVG